MKIVVTGGTGLIGTRLVKALAERGDEAIVLTRNPEGAGARALPPKARVVSWPAPAGLRSLVSESDAVINLAGEPVVAKRWTPEQQQVIRDSRVKTTQLIFDALRTAPRPPGVVVNASAIGYYGPHGSDRLTEVDPVGSDFLAEVCRDWEEATKPHPQATRVVRARIGVVFAPAGGALEQMVRPFKMFGGGPIGNGSQWVSWVHIDDVVALLLFALETPKIDGAMNITAPEPVTNRELSKLIGKVLRRPSWLPVPKFALKMALGDVAEVLVTGQRVLPDVALKAGFAFAHPQCEEALRSVLG